MAPLFARNLLQPLIIYVLLLMMIFLEEEFLPNYVRGFRISPWFLRRELAAFGQLTVTYVLIIFFILITSFLGALLLNLFCSGLDL